MPIYEYRCQACQAEFEQLVRSSRDGRQVACPRCGGQRVERRPSVFAAHRGQEKVSLPQSPCARCGDPNGSCPFA